MTVVLGDFNLTFFCPVHLFIRFWRLFLLFFLIFSDHSYSQPSRLCIVFNCIQQLSEECYVAETYSELVCWSGVSEPYQACQMEGFTKINNYFCKILHVRYLIGFWIRSVTSEWLLLFLTTMCTGRTRSLCSSISRSFAKMMSWLRDTAHISNIFKVLQLSNKLHADLS